MLRSFERKWKTGEVQTNYMRQYYDVYSLLNNEKVLAFIGSTNYKEHKEKRFPKADFAIPVKANEAFLLQAKEERERCKNATKEPKHFIIKVSQLLMRFFNVFTNI